MMNIEVKLFHKIFANRIQGHTKDILYLDQVGFFSRMQAWYNIGKHCNAIYQLTTMKET